MPPVKAAAVIHRVLFWGHGHIGSNLEKEGQLNKH